MQLADLVQSKNNNFTPSGDIAMLSLDMAKAISKAVKFVSKDKSNLRPALSHVCFHIKYDTLTIAATNAEWAYISEPFNIGLDKTFPEHKYLVTVAEARSIAKAIRANKAMYLQTGTLKQFVGVQSTERLPCIKVYKGDYELLCCPKSDMRYPEYDRYIPEAINTFTYSLIKFEDLIADIVGKFMHGGAKYNKLDYGSIPKHNPITGEITGSKNFPMALVYHNGKLSLNIGTKKSIAYQRILKPEDSHLEGGWAVYLNANLLWAIVGLIPSANDIFVATTGSKSNGVVIAPEGSQEKFLLMPLQL